VEKTAALKRKTGLPHRALDLFGVLATAEGLCQPGHAWCLTWPRIAERQQLVMVSGIESVDLLIAAQIERVPYRGPENGIEWARSILCLLAGQFPRVVDTTAIEVAYNGAVPVCIVGIDGTNKNKERLATEVACVIEHVARHEETLQELAMYRLLLNRCSESLLATDERGRVIAGTDSGRRLLRIALYGSPRSPFKDKDDVIPTRILSSLLVGLPASSNKIEITPSPFREFGRSGLTEPLILVSLRTIETIGSAISPDRLAKLTPTQKEVFHCLIQGDRNKGIAVRMGISPYTARNHVSVVLQTLQCSDRLELIARYRRFNATPDEIKHFAPDLPATPFVADLPIKPKRIHASIRKV